MRMHFQLKEALIFVYNRKRYWKRGLRVSDMKDEIRKIIRELSICTSPETADRENVKACRFLLAMFTAACASAVLLQLLFFGRLHNQAFMQGFIGFVFLDLIYIVYHDVIDRKPALSTELPAC